MVSAPAGSSSRRNEQISSSSRRVAVELGLHEHRDHVVGGMHAPLGDDRAEVVEQRVATRRSARSSSKPALITSTARRWNIGQVFAGQAEQARDHETGNGNVELAHEVGALVGRSMNASMCLVDDVAHELAFPRLHRLAAESFNSRDRDYSAAAAAEAAPRPRPRPRCPGSGMAYGRCPPGSSPTSRTRTSSATPRSTTATRTSSAARSTSPSCRR